MPTVDPKKAVTWDAKCAVLVPRRYKSDIVHIFAAILVTAGDMQMGI